MGREEGSGWGTHVYLWQIHFDIWQNQYNIVKLNKIKFKKKIKNAHWKGHRRGFQNCFGVMTTPPSLFSQTISKTEECPSETLP